MSVELLYTSAAQGLKQGSRGFCTVVSTAGMPLNLATRLESLSAYRHVFAPGHPDAAQNPVSFSHLRLNVGGRPLSILSRISDYGVDYSQRTNKLAHHVVLEGADLVPAGPAWVMSQPGVMRSQWDGQCSTPGSGPAIPATNQSPRVCMRWSGLCGDAGWGGVVAEVFAQPVGKPLWIIFPLNQSSELLALINESIALLAPAQRWQATFSTYATNLPPDADCKVRCVLAGTEDARLAPARGKVIDLSKPLPPIASTAITPYILAARNGTPVPAAVPSVPTAGATSKPRPPVPHSESAEEFFDVDESNLAAGTQLTQKSRPSSGLKSARSPSAPPAMKNKQLGADSKSPETLAASSRKLKWSMIGLSVVAALLLISTVFLLVQRQPVEVAKQDSHEATKDELIGATKPEDVAPALEQKEDGLASDASTLPKSPVAEPPPEVMTAPQGTVQKPDAEEDSVPPASDIEPKPKVETPTPKANNPGASSATPNKVEPNKSPALAANSGGLKPDVLIGEIQAAKLLKGEVSVRLDIEGFTHLTFEDSRFSYEKTGRPYKSVGSLDDAKRPQNIKQLECIESPFKLVVEVENKDKALKERASKIRATWGSITKAIVGWQNALRKSGFTRSQAIELLIDKPEEPKVNASVPDLQKQLVELSERTEQVLERIAEHEAELAKKNTPEEAAAHFQVHTDGLNKFQELLASLQREIEDLANVDGEFDTGTIVYVGRAKEGELVDAEAITRVYRFKEKSVKDKEKPEAKMDNGDAKPKPNQSSPASE